MPSPIQQPLNMIDTQKTTLMPSVFDANGLSMPTPAGSVCSYSVDNAAILSLTAAPDGLATLLSGIAVGTANVTASLSIPGIAGAFVQTMVVTLTAAPQVPSGFTIAFSTPA